MKKSGAILWRSPPLSADRGEFTLLAVLETILAVSISVWIAWQYQTLSHIAISAFIAPFLLLRSHRSVLLGISNYVSFGQYLSDRIGVDVDDLTKERPSRIEYAIFWSFYYTRAFPFLLLIVVFIPIVARVTAVISTLLADPIKALKQVPRNWTRVVLCVDMCYPPELLPGLNVSNISPSHGLMTITLKN